MDFETSVRPPDPLLSSLRGFVVWYALIPTFHSTLKADFNSVLPEGLFIPSPVLPPHPPLAMISRIRFRVQILSGGGSFPLSLMVWFPFSGLRP